MYIQDWEFVPLDPWYRVFPYTGGGQDKYGTGAGSITYCPEAGYCTATSGEGCGVDIRPWGGILSGNTKAIYVYVTYGRNSVAASYMLYPGGYGWNNVIRGYATLPGNWTTNTKYTAVTCHSGFATTYGSPGNACIASVKEGANYQSMISPANVEDPSGVIYLFDAWRGEKLGFAQIGIPSFAMNADAVDYMYALSADSSQTTSSQKKCAINPKRHSGSFNCWYFDGHVKSVRFGDSYDGMWTTQAGD
jgi:prepilin-type processing-associated H-X9-DG protein